ncbi:Enamine deaminase RidA, house cleaning of reactive enamine intermediates, YjgF/YER057c/UK114 family [Paracoccus halophilus]|uniref:Enamine deaminase RidA, house cleaning of reactive enamine intermediates, YjgF/YER057c/UK114 family n=1 Tax=Paracoccus halophilus TaxID=376733 RepID=A0A099EW67_9RHOB|nr:RidA family protein [Paracoccus halophilus]KGJ02635.1 endoribonuclease L-PSP [Paracoccus halophilus]SFA60577.1 Enamine deaminase RidA, house cleaning of reactive enamine intermediates, YjgF/YER057c/UK114 family [Paracoccus halophilus]
MSAPHPAPVPQGDYVPATRHGALIFTAGMTPRLDGKLVHQGLIRKDTPIETCRDAVILACGNALQAARGKLAEGERIAAILSMTVYIAAEEAFTAHSRLADFASEFLRARLGEAGIGSRCAVGVATLPGNAPVEIQLVAGV